MSRTRPAILDRSQRWPDIHQPPRRIRADAAAVHARRSRIPSELREPAISPSWWWWWISATKRLPKPAAAPVPARRLPKPTATAIPATRRLPTTTAAAEQQRPTKRRDRKSSQEIPPESPSGDQEELLYRHVIISLYYIAPLIFFFLGISRHYFFKNPFLDTPLPPQSNR